MNQLFLSLVLGITLLINATLTKSIPTQPQTASIRQRPPAPPVDLNEEPELLKSMLSKLKEARLDKYIISDGSSEIVDVKSLFFDPKAVPVMIDFLKEHGYSVPNFVAVNHGNLSPSSIKDVPPPPPIIRLKRNIFDAIGKFFSNAFSSISSTIQQNAMIGFQSLVSDSIKQLLGQVEQTLFLGTPLNFTGIVTQFVADVKTSLRNVIVATVETTIQDQALRLLDLQTNELNKLLDSLNSKSIGPVQFVSSLQGVLESINTSLKALVPSVTDTIGQQLHVLLTQILNSVPPEVDARR